MGEKVRYRAFTCNKTDSFDHIEACQAQHPGRVRTKLRHIVYIIFGKYCSRYCSGVSSLDSFLQEFHKGMQPNLNNKSQNQYDSCIIRLIIVIPLKKSCCRDLEKAPIWRPSNLARSAQNPPDRSLGTIALVEISTISPASEKRIMRLVRQNAYQQTLPNPKHPLLTEGLGA